MRERGLKHIVQLHLPSFPWVAPHAGAWIETSFVHKNRSKFEKSLPMRERGLKLVAPKAEPWVTQVAPHAGAWIETPKQYTT